MKLLLYITKRYQSNLAHEEIRIPVPWGHLAGKWWGVQDKRPVLTLHGWQDNSGSFDRLIPLLPKNVGYLAVDMPGHGRSSRLPPGGVYGGINSIITIKLIKEFFQWNTVSFLAHSNGAMSSYSYSFIHPGTTDFLICMDSMQMDTNPIKSARIRKNLDGFIKYDRQSRAGTEPPFSYTLEEMARKLHVGSGKSIDLDKCKYILERNVIPAKGKPAMFHFNADPRLKCWDLINWSAEVHREAAKLITCPVMITITHDKRDYIGSEVNSFVDLVQASELFEAHKLEGTHHAHLNGPEVFARLIREFMKKHDTSDRSWDFDFNRIRLWNENKKILIIDILFEILKNLKFESKDTVIFFNLYGFLLQEICHPEDTSAVRNISEEYKLSIVRCATQLLKTFSWELVPSIYCKERVPEVSILLYLCLKLAQYEKLRQLRIAAIECVLTLAKLDDEETPDFEQYKIISDMFMYFLPGIAAALVKICTEDEKCGHRVVVTGLRAWARLVTLCMKDYSGAEDDIDDVLNIKPSAEVPRKKFESGDDIDRYLSSLKRNAAWYAQHDEKLVLCVNLLTKLATSQHPDIRRELMSLCDFLGYYCLRTLPNTSGKAIEILISLTGDEHEDIGDKCRVILTGLSEKIAGDGLKMKTVRDTIEQNFYNSITKLPRVFNGLDEREQITALNVIIGYLGIFKKHRLKQILFSATNLNRIILSLIHIATLRTDVSLLEEYSIQDFEESADDRTPWKVFSFHSKRVERKLEEVCRMLAQPDVSDIVLDYLMDLYVNDVEHRREVILIINEILSVPWSYEDNVKRVKPFIATYLDREFWELPLAVDSSEERKCTWGEAQSNVTQICLQIEGIGKMATALKGGFKEFLLRVLYPVLEKAGSGNPFLRAAGLAAVSKISTACNHASITELINENSDYFSYHVMRKLKRPVHDEGVLNVLSVVIKHSSIEVLPSLAEIIDGVLLQSCDRYELGNANAYLHVFKVFVKSLHKWLDVRVIAAPMRSKAERERDIEDFKISNLESVDADFSDEAVMGKSAEEMWKEDAAKGGIEEEFEPAVEEYSKPEAPMHIKLTVSILKRSLNFLPSKDQNRKILTLEILRDGIEILHDWEDELLPMVHLIWSPLVNRFKDDDAPLVVNLSFQLLTSLARLSKDFIRSRTVKEVLPALSQIVKKRSQLSYLKDIGSAYRFTQGYKMQLAVLPELGRLCYDLDVAESGAALVVQAVEPYLSNKQPLRFQEAAVEFYKTLFMIDPLVGKKFVEELEDRFKNNPEYHKNYSLIANHMLIQT